jgi:hypothetical protein
MWAKHFAIALGLGIAIILAFVSIVFGLVMLGKIYGTGAVLSVIAAMFLILSAGGLSYQYSRDKLMVLEREEERTMEALKEESKSFLDKTIKDSYKKLILNKSGTHNNVFK